MLESRLNDLQKKTRYHDDHLRTVDIWFHQVRALDTIWSISLTLLQLLDEIRVSLHGRANDIECKLSVRIPRENPSNVGLSTKTISLVAVVL